MSVSGISKAAICCGSAKSAAKAVHLEKISFVFILADNDRSGCKNGKKRRNDDRSRKRRRVPGRLRRLERNKTVRGVHNVKPTDKEGAISCRY